MKSDNTHICSLTPSPFKRGSEVKTKTAFIPYGTNAVASVVPPSLGLSKPHFFEHKHLLMLQLYNGSSPSWILFSEYQMNFTSRLGGPFCAFVSGRAFNNRLLSVPSLSAYLSSSQPFPAMRDDIDFR